MSSLSSDMSEERENHDFLMSIEKLRQKKNLLPKSDGWTYSVEQNVLECSQWWSQGWNDHLHWESWVDGGWFTY